MYWRQTGREQQQNAGASNKKRLKEIVDDRVPGLLAYQDGHPAGWCCIAPREEFGRLARSAALKPVDDQPVWSVVCFYIGRGYRRQGIALELLKAAVRYASDQGAKIIEGYPVDPKERKVENSDAYTGVPDMFLESGFQEVARRSNRRPIMRYYT